MSGVELLYDELAGSYDSIYKSKRHDVENLLMRHWLSRKPVLEGDVLDAGCGTGYLLDLLNISEQRYTGIDVSERMLEIAAEKHPRHKFMQADLMRYHSIKKYDAVVAVFSVLDYCGLELIQWAASQLRDGGIFMTTFIKDYEQPYGNDFMARIDVDKVKKEFKTHFKLRTFRGLSHFSNREESMCFDRYYDVQKIMRGIGGIDGCRYVTVEAIK